MVREIVPRKVAANSHLGTLDRLDLVLGAQSQFKTEELDGRTLRITPIPGRLFGQVGGALVAHLPLKPEMGSIELSNGNVLDEFLVKSLCAIARGATTSTLRI